MNPPSPPLHPSHSHTPLTPSELGYKDKEYDFKIIKQSTENQQEKQIGVISYKGNFYDVELENINLTDIKIQELALTTFTLVKIHLESQKPSKFEHFKKATFEVDRYEIETSPSSKDPYSYEHFSPSSLSSPNTSSPAQPTLDEPARATAYKVAQVAHNILTDRTAASSETSSVITENEEKERKHSIATNPPPPTTNSAPPLESKPLLMPPIQAPLEGKTTSPSSDLPSEDEDPATKKTQLEKRQRELESELEKCSLLTKEIYAQFQHNLQVAHYVRDHKLEKHSNNREQIEQEFLERVEVEEKSYNNQSAEVKAQRKPLKEQLETINAQLAAMNNSQSTTSFISEPHSQSKQQPKLPESSLQQQTLTSSSKSPTTPKSATSAETPTRTSLLTLFSSQENFLAVVEKAAAVSKDGQTPSLDPTQLSLTFTTESLTTDRVIQKLPAPKQSHQEKLLEAFGDTFLTALKTTLDQEGLEPQDYEQLKTSVLRDYTSYLNLPTQIKHVPILTAWIQELPFSLREKIENKQKQAIERLLRQTLKKKAIRAPFLHLIKYHQSASAIVDRMNFKKLNPDSITLYLFKLSLRNLLFDLENPNKRYDRDLCIRLVQEHFEHFLREFNLLENQDQQKHFINAYLEPITDKLFNYLLGSKLFSNDRGKLESDDKLEDRERRRFADHIESILKKWKPLEEELIPCSEEAFEILKKQKHDQVIQFANQALGENFLLEFPEETRSSFVIEMSTQISQLLEDGHPLDTIYQNLPSIANNIAQRFLNREGESSQDYGKQAQDLIQAALEAGKHKAQLRLKSPRQ